VTLFDPATGRKLFEVQGTSDYQDGAYELAFLTNGRLAMAAQAKETVRLVDPATGRVVKTLQGHTGWVSGLCPGRVVIRSSRGAPTARSGSGAWKNAKVHRSWMPDPVCSRGSLTVRTGRWLATAGDKGPVKLRDLRNGGESVELQGNGLPVNGLDFSPDGRWLACAQSISWPRTG